MAINNCMQLSIAKAHLAQKFKEVITNWTREKRKSITVKDTLAVMKKELGMSEGIYPTWVANNKKELSEIETDLIAKKSIVLFLEEVDILFEDLNVKEINLHRIADAIRYGIILTQVQLEVLRPGGEFLDYIEKEGINIAAYHNEESPAIKTGELWIFIEGRYYRVDAIVYKIASDFS